MRLGRRIVPPARGAALLLALGVLLGIPAVAGSGTAADPLTVDRAAPSVRWREGWLKGTVSVAGTVQQPAQLYLVLRRAAPPLTVVLTKRMSAPGPRYSTSLKLPARPLPGPYTVTVTATAGGETIGEAARPLTIRAPVEGIVDLVVASATRNGPKRAVVPGPRRSLFARFHFAYPPQARKVTIVWCTPDFRYVGETLNTSSVTKPYRTTVSTRIHASRPLDAGRWYTFLYVRARLAKRTDIRITPSRGNPIVPHGTARCSPPKRA